MKVIRGQNWDKELVGRTIDEDGGLAVIFMPHTAFSSHSAEVLKAIITGEIKQSFVILLSDFGTGSRRKRSDEILKYIGLDADRSRLFVFSTDSMPDYLFLQKHRAVLGGLFASSDEDTGGIGIEVDDARAVYMIKQMAGSIIAHSEPVNPAASRLVLEIGLDKVPTDDAYSEIYTAITGSKDEVPLPLSAPTGAAETVQLSEDMDWGNIFLSEGSDSNMAYELFNGLIRAGANGFVISRDPESRCRQAHSVPEAAGIFWLSKQSGPLNISPTNIGKLLFRISSYLQTTENSVILIDGLEYLISNNGFANVIRWLDDIEETVILTHSILIVALDPETLDNKQLKLLEKHKILLTPEYAASVSSLMDRAPGALGITLKAISGHREKAKDADALEGAIDLKHPYIVMKDQDGKPLHGVSVECRASGVYHFAITDASGLAIFNDLDGSMFPDGTRFFASKTGYKSLIWDAGILQSGTEHTLTEQSLDELIKEAENAHDISDYKRAYRYLHRIYSKDPNNSKYWFYKKLWHQELQDKVSGVHEDPQCEVCNGDGICNLCEGTSRCQHCDSGKCAECGGTGLVGGDVCPVCHGTGECTFCEGSGICSHCMGTGTCNECVLPQIQYECQNCGNYIYRPWVGDMDSGIGLWTLFEELPPNWTCPVCGAGKESFKKVK